MSSLSLSAYQAEMDARFAAAARHSRLVRTLRVAVPAAVAVAMAAIIAVSVLNPFRLLAKLPIDPGRLVVSGTKVTMESPHLSGFTPDGRPYELWAKAATQDLTRPDQVDLSTLRAKLLTEDQSTVMIDARNGVFDTKSQLLQLRKDVYLLATSGYEAWLTQALVDLGKGTISSDEPVDVKWQGGTLRGQKLRITERGDLVRFDGGVVMHLDNAGPASPTTTPANSSAK
ncbi:lipopolysaccharide export system protein LptC [Rhodopseudomonas faecalis]|uniref:Lipopolysaccharide export system protein LptC n=1 Tax=Rhodopseudomonas faecalis TaxID=99655 RepID=A0A318TEV1_9BRAD|nr:lipopolysaccharide export system protein LptC [Rhodopseudomonas faecalis]